MSLIDTHCHLNFHQYAEDRQQVIDRAGNAGVNSIIIPAVDVPTAHEAVALAQEHMQIYAAVGVHPTSTANFSGEILAEIERIHDSAPKIVAVGEIGLDYYWDKSPKPKQIEAFEAQLDLARKLELPVIIHNREASEDVITVLENWAATLPPSLKDRPGVLHSFSAPAEIAHRALKLNFYLGFTGPITYKNADDLRRIAAEVPEDKILVETDGPFLTPVPYRGKRNEPAYIPLMVDRLASLKQITTKAMGAITTENAERLFQLS